MPEKRKFFDVELPIINSTVSLIGNVIEDLNNRSVKMDLTRKLKGKSLEITYSITVKDGKPEASPTRIFLLPFYIRRAMRKSADYVEDSFIAKCHDHTLRIKFLLITRKKVSRAVRNALRVKAIEEITNEIKEVKYADILSDLLSNKFQKILSLKLKKVYPLAFCEIKEMITEKQKLKKTKEDRVEEVKEVQEVATQI